MTTELRREIVPTTRLPLVLRWDTTHPLPVRPVQAQAGRAGPGVEAPPWLLSGPPGEPFDFCGHVRRLCTEISARCPTFAHLNLDNLLFTVTQARSGRRHGLQARVTPLRFPGGRLRTARRGHCYQVQRFIVDGREMLYHVTFCLPRFLDQEFDDKFVTLFHELYHISPAFDGDLRRHNGRCSIHTHSMKAYDAHMADLAREYLATRPDPNLHAFLRLKYPQLIHRHGSVVGTVVPRPKLIPVVLVDGEK